jgi:predicted anti-sigma-YlaC factor YlaD
MKCRRIQPQLLDFNYGRLELDAAEVVTAHLRRCADCRRVLERERRTALMLSGFATVVPRTDPWPAVAAALRGAHSPTSARYLARWRLVWAGGLAAAILVAGLIAPTFRSSIPPLETEALGALAPAASAGLAQERSPDPLLAVQDRVDQLLDRLAEKGS